MGDLKKRACHSKLLYTLADTGRGQAANDVSSTPYEKFMVKEAILSHEHRFTDMKMTMNA